MKKRLLITQDEHSACEGVVKDAMKELAEVEGGPVKCGRRAMFLRLRVL